MRDQKSAKTILDFLNRCTDEVTKVMLRRNVYKSFGVSSLQNDKDKILIVRDDETCEYQIVFLINKMSGVNLSR
jgi:hypothetical protein